MVDATRFFFFFGVHGCEPGRVSDGSRPALCHAKLSLSNAARLSFSDLCILLFLFLSLCRLCVCVFLCSHWSLVDVPLIFFCPADHVPDWQPRVLLGMVEVRSVNVKKTTTTTTLPIELDVGTRQELARQLYVTQKRSWAGSMQGTILVPFVPLSVLHTFVSAQTLGSSSCSQELIGNGFRVNMNACKPSKHAHHPRKLLIRRNI